MDIVPSGNKSKEQNLIELEEAANSHADKIKAKLRYDLHTQILFL